jgi:hypothetical protein
MSGPKDIHHNTKQDFPWPLIRCVEAKSWVGSDWLRSSSKLQPCLVLCQFVQALLKTTDARWKVHLNIRSSKRPMCIIHWDGWRITRGTQLEGRVLHLESRCYNKSHLGPKLTTLLRLIIKSLSLFVSNPCLTFLSSACISFTPNQVYSLVPSIIKPYHCAFVSTFL